MNTSELRRLAETAKYLYTETDPPCAFDNMLMHKWMETCSPATLLELLDRLDAAEKVCRAAVQYLIVDSEVNFIDFSDVVEEWQEVGR